MKHLLFLLVCLYFLSFPASSFSQADQSGPILWTARWSKDGNYIAVGGNDGALRLFHGKSYELIQTYPVGSDIMRLDWHPQKPVLAMGTFGNKAYLIDVEKGRFSILSGMKEGTRGISWSSDGKYLAGGLGEGAIIIWDEDGVKTKKINKENTKSYTSLAWHPDRDTLITLSESIRFYNAKGELLKKFNHRKEEVLLLCVAWHPSGDFFVIGDYGDEKNEPLLQFRNADGSLRKEKKGSKAAYRNIRWSPDGKWIATASDALRIWSKKGKLLNTGSSEDNLWGVDWSPDGKFIVTSSEEGHIIIWNKKGNIVKQVR
jgi:WD40 repeat protein